MDDFFFRIIVILAAFVIAFALLREVMTWYWKQNEIVDLLKEQNKLLRFLANNTEPLDEDPEIDEEKDEKVKKRSSFMDKVKEAEEELKHRK